MLVQPIPPAGLGAHLDELRASFREEAGRKPALAPLLTLIAAILSRLIAVLDSLATNAASTAIAGTPQTRRPQAASAACRGAMPRQAPHATITRKRNPAAQPPAPAPRRVAPNRAGAHRPGPQRTLPAAGRIPRALCRGTSRRLASHPRAPPPAQKTHVGSLHLFTSFSLRYRN